MIQNLKYIFKDGVLFFKKDITVKSVVDHATIKIEKERAVGVGVQKLSEVIAANVENVNM